MRTIPESPSANTRNASPQRERGSLTGALGRARERTRSLSRLAMLILFASTLASAQEPTKKQPARRKPPQNEQPGEFPEPLGRATGNLRDLERTGFLSVVSVADRAVDRQGHTGIVWTIKTNKPITARHVQSLLRPLRDVKFYLQQKTTRREVYTALLHYSRRIDIGASSGLVFLEDDQLEVWIELNDAARRRLKAQDVDLVVFQPLKR